MKRLIIIISIITLFASIAYAKLGLNLGLELGSGATSVSGPVTPSGHYLLIDGSSHSILIDSSHKLRIDGAS